MSEKEYIYKYTYRNMYIYICVCVLKHFTAKMTVIISEFGGKFAQVQGSMHVTASRIPHSSPWLSAINTFGNDGNLGAWHLSKTTPTAHLKHPLVVENVILEKPVMIYLLRPHTHTK